MLINYNIADKAVVIGIASQLPNYEFSSLNTEAFWVSTSSEESKNSNTKKKDTTFQQVQQITLFSPPQRESPNCFFRKP
jgi:hypothetical protein